MGKSGGTPKVPGEQRKLYRFSLDVLRGAQHWWQTDQNRAFFGLEPPVMGPDALDYAARSAALRSFGGGAFQDVLGAVKATATGAPEDISQYADIIEKNEWARMGTDVKESVGGKLGTAMSDVTVRELAHAHTDLSAKFGLMKMQFREQAYQRALEAARLYGQLGAMQAETLSRAGMAFRQARNFGFERAYSDILMRRYQIPLQMASAAAGTAGSMQYYMTPQRNPWAGALAGAGAGAAIGGAMKGASAGPIGAGIGAVLGMLAYG